MAKTIWAVDLGDWSLKVARGTFAKKSGTITVELYDEIVYGELPCGFEAGPLERQREGLIAFRQRYDLNAGDDLCVSVSGREVFNRFINLPPVPESIDDIIRYEARQQIPFDIDEVVWDYQTIKEQYELGEEIEVGLFALKKERVSELMDLLGPYTANLRVIQDAPLAVYNFLEYEGYGEDALVVADVGAGTTDLIVFNPPRFWLRTVLVAGDDLTQVLMQKFDIHAAEAERVKRKTATSEHRARIMNMFGPVVDELTSEIQRSLGYYKSLAREARFERILAVGNGMRLDGLEKMLGKGLQYDVQGLEALRRIELGEGVDREDFRQKLPGACAALGLLVQGADLGRMRVNMVPERVALGNALSKKKPVLLAAALCLLLAAGIAIAGEAIIRGRVAGAREELEQYEPVINRVQRNNQEFQSAQSEIEALAGELQNLARPRLNAHLYEHLVPALLKALPEEEVYLRSLRAHWVDPAVLQAEVGEEGEREFPERDEPVRRGERGDIPGPLPGSPEPEQGANSALVLTFEGETFEVREEEFVEENVFAALEKATYPDGETSVFTQVDPFSVQAEDTGGVPRRIFRGRAVVNLDVAPLMLQVGPPAQEGTEQDANGSQNGPTGDTETETER